MKKAFSAFISSSLLASSFAIGTSLLSATSAQALQFGFNNITSNNALNAAAGEKQLFVDVLDAFGGENLSSNQVMFKFSNVGPAASSITQIYFDNSNLLNSITGINDSDRSGKAVSFSVPNKNGNLPGGNNVGFAVDFSVQADAPVQPSGVNPGEWVSVLFNLNAGKTLQNVFNDLLSGALRTGFHVQGFANGGSEAFVNKTTAVLPPAPPAPPAPPTPPTPPTPPAPPVVQEPTPPAPPAPPVVQEPTPPAPPAPPVVLEPTPPAQPEVRSVPEPSTVGALLLASFAALGLGKKRRENKQ